ncbi:gamma-glutamylaminecyclotransferase isoform X1 [Oryzias latipes]|uniref:gamma-glutamylaminecyclotransferase isoform X1 n=1 Tax=Oryzias latipes TaxID=8090 RepID=UPI0009DA629B|nr:gamma-glutamylaminecyclotransferase isoform X1 [Oryzias latipes]
MKGKKKRFAISNRCCAVLRFVYAVVSAARLQTCLRHDLSCAFRPTREPGGKGDGVWGNGWKHTVSLPLMPRVFVYGTLKRGQPNHYRMLDATNGKAEFLATALTTQRYPLVIATEYNIPFLLNLPGQGQRVRGEIYEVDERMLAFLDAFESVPSMYQRTVVDLEVEDGGAELPPGSITQVFVYSTTSYQPDWPSGRSFQSYDTHSDHGLPYVYREARD